jgi:hypothetical protein
MPIFGNEILTGARRYLRREESLAYSISGIGSRFDQAAGPAGVRIYVAEGVHSVLYRLESILDAIQKDLKASPPQDWRVLFFGDYHHGGLNSPQVTDRLIRLSEEFPQNVVTLAGLRDIQLLEFLSSAAPVAETYERFSAFKAVLHAGRAYGLDLDWFTLDDRLSNKPILQAAVPSNHVEFLKRLSPSITLGSFFFCCEPVYPAVVKKSPNGSIWIRRVHDGWDFLLDEESSSSRSKLPIRVHVKLELRNQKEETQSILVIEGREKRLLGS